MINISDNQPDDSTIDGKYEILSSALLAQEIKDNLDKDTAGKANIHLERFEPSHHHKNDLANALNNYLKVDPEAIPKFDDLDPDYYEPISGGFDPHRDKLLHHLHDEKIISLKPYIEKEEAPYGGVYYDEVQFYEVSVNTKLFPNYYIKTTKEAQPYIEAFIKQKSDDDEIQKSDITVQTEPVAPTKLSQNGQTHKVSLRRLQKTLRLYIDGNDASYPVMKFKSVSANNYKACKILCQRKRSWLTKEQLEIPNAKTVIKDIPKTMGITGPLLRFMIEFDSTKQTIRLLDDVRLNSQELENLLNYVQANYRLS